MQVRKAKDDVDAVLLSNLGELNVLPDSFVYLGRGKYSVGKDKKTVLLKVLNKVFADPPQFYMNKIPIILQKVMVRVGGGWQDLKEYIARHPELHVALLLRFFLAVDLGPSRRKTRR